MRTIDEIKAEIKRREDEIREVAGGKDEYSIDRINYNKAILYELKNEYRSRIMDGIGIDRLEEICNAEKDGRCVIQEECQFDKREYGLDNGDPWECSECGLEWVLENGDDPFENGMSYCPSCGRKIKLITWEETMWDDETVIRLITKEQAEEKLAELNEVIE